MHNSRYWEVEYTDGTIIKEFQADWKDIKKDKVVRLSMWFDGRCWHIKNAPMYLQKKRGSSIPGISNSDRIESRSIGYHDGFNKVWYTVNEHTGKFSMEVVPV